MPTTKKISPAVKTRRRKPASVAKKRANRNPMGNTSPSKSKLPKGSGRRSALSLESDLFRALMTNTTDRIYFKDAESRFLLINQSTAAEMGLGDPSEIIGKTDFDFFSEEHARNAYTDEQQIIASGHPMVGIEEKETWPDGRETWVSTTKFPMRDREGRTIGIFGISRDISEHKQGEAARIAAAVLKESNVGLEKSNAALQVQIAERRRAEAVLDRERNLLRELIDNLPEFIFAKDTEGRFTLANRALALHMGASKPEDLYGKNDFDFYPADLASQFQAEEQALLQSGQRIIEHEEPTRGVDGRPMLTLTTKVLLYDNQGRIIGLAGNSQDITERKSMELSTRHANEELGKTNAALQQEIAERLRAETALDNERNLFRTMMDNTSDHIYFKDAESHFLLINKAQAVVFGLDDPSKAVGKTDFDFFTEEHARQAFGDEQKIIQNEKPLVGVEEKETWPDGHETWVSTTKIPMRDQAGRIIGTIGISRDITERKAMELSVQLANTQLEIMVNWLEGRNREINVLNEMGKLLQTCRSSEEAYPVISNQMEKLIPVQEGRLFQLSQDTGLFDVVASWGKDSDRTESFPPQDCQAILSGSIYFINAKNPGSYCPHLRPEPGEDADYFCIPLKAQGETIGVLHLRNRREKGNPDTLLDSKQELATMAADHIALALANLSLRETLRIQSIRDALTGLYNRRYLEESLQRELARSKRKRTGLGVVMLDVDNLKQVNDVFGHEAGDTLLMELGHWLQSNVRAEDISCRYGGDEFVLILPDASLESTYQRARQICEGVRSLKISYNDRSLGSVTVSIGVAGFPENGESRDALFAAVDAALYKAKERGRNCVVDAAEKFSAA
jgi:diguanylate cyclase (GGDEF)-like protein/PAS domain S-box-containing protein